MPQFRHGTVASLSCMKWKLFQEILPFRSEDIKHHTFFKAYCAMDDICRHYGVTNIRLHDIDKQWGHPSVAGMESIARQVREALQTGE